MSELRIHGAFVQMAAPQLRIHEARAEFVNTSELRIHEAAFQFSDIDPAHLLIYDAYFKFAPAPVRHIWTSGAWEAARRHVWTSGAWVAVDEL